jgi:hypothetical protein
MADEGAEKVASINEGTKTDGAKRVRSSIEFPYGDLDDAIELAKAVQAVGGQSCTIDQLAAQVKQSANSGAFRLRTSYPRIFALAELDRGTMSLTELGLRILDPTQEERARAEAFLRVPLYKAIYEKYKGYTLPPPAALEREMAGLGVSAKQTDRARQVFDRSAQQANFYWSGKDRLVMPPLKDGPGSRPLDTGTPGATGAANSALGGGGGGGESELDLDPLLIALLKKIPIEGKGSWPAAQRIRWFRTFAMNVSQIYDEDDDPVEMEIKAAKADE